MDLHGVEIEQFVEYLNTIEENFPAAKQSNENSTTKKGTKIDYPSIESETGTTVVDYGRMSTLLQETFFRERRLFRLLPSQEQSEETTKRL